MEEYCIPKLVTDYKPKKKELPAEQGSDGYSKLKYMRLNEPEW